MANGRQARKLPFAESVKVFIAEFTDLTYDGAKIVCGVCDQTLLFANKGDCRRHVNSAKHIRNKRTDVPSNTEFMLDITTTFLACNLPFTLLDQEPYQRLWSKYNPTLPLPSRRTLQRNVPNVQEEIINKIKLELANKNLWLCLDEMTDIKKNSIVNLIVRPLDPHHSTSSLLLASKRVDQPTSGAITNLVLDSLVKFELSPNQILMLITNGTSTMRSVGCALKEVCENLLHVTCKIHALHLVVGAIRQCYPDVNSLITNTKAVFRKSPKHIQEFHRICPHIPQPPQQILTPYGTWLKVAFYYHTYYRNIKRVVLNFDRKEAPAIRNSQIKFQDLQVQTDLQTIRNNYFVLVEAIEKLKNPSLSLLESVQIVNDVHAHLQAIEDPVNYHVMEKFESILDKDSDFITLNEICDGACTGSLSGFKDYFNYANITSLDVQRSFSAYKNIYSSRRTSLAETTVEAYLMQLFYSRSQEAQDNDP